MKKKIIIFVSIIIILRCLIWYFDILRFYNYPTSANEPNLKEGARFVSSSLIKPTREDFICYKVKTDTVDFEVAMRLMALPNDTLEIINGVTFVNGINKDENLNLRRIYKLEKTYFQNIIKPLVKENQYYKNYKVKDTFFVFLDKIIIERNKLNVSSLIEKVNIRNEIVFNIYHENWNNDNFGPIIIPKDNYFVLGDNRNNAFDSRYTGFVKEEAIIGTIFYIYQ